MNSANTKSAPSLANNVSMNAYINIKYIAREEIVVLLAIQLHPIAIGH